jgi:hypothetical protein
MSVSTTGIFLREAPIKCDEIEDWLSYVKLGKDSTRLKSLGT